MFLATEFGTSSHKLSLQMSDLSLSSDTMTTDTSSSRRNSSHPVRKTSTKSPAHVKKPLAKKRQHSKSSTEMPRQSSSDLAVPRRLVRIKVIETLPTGLQLLGIESNMPASPTSPHVSMPDAFTFRNIANTLPYVSWLTDATGAVQAFNDQ